MAATKKKANEPRARIAAPNKVKTAMAVTPVGRFTLLPSLKNFASHTPQRHAAAPSRCQRRNDQLSRFSKGTSLIVIWMAVAPVPVVVLVSVILLAVLAVTFVTFG
jgi:hypothetical protein